MFRIDARKTLLALSLFAAVGAMLLPGSHAASAAAIPATESVSDAQLIYEQTPPKPVPTFNTMAITLAGETHVGKVTHYHFQVHAVNGTLPNVTVEMRSEYFLISNNSFGGWSPAVTQNLGTMSAPHTLYVDITCTPPNGMYCGGAYAGALSSNGASAAALNEADGFKS